MGKDPVFCTRANEAIQLARWTVQKGDELTLDGLMAAAFHVGGFAVACPDLALCLPKPEPQGPRIPLPVPVSQLLRHVFHHLTEDDRRRFNIDARYDEVSIDELMAVLFFNPAGLEHLRTAGATEDVLAEFVKVLFRRLASSILKALIGQWYLAERRGGFLGETESYQNHTLELREDGTLVFHDPPAESRTGSFEIELIHPGGLGTTTITAELEPCLLIGDQRQVIRLDHHAGTLILEDDVHDGFTYTYLRVQ